MINALPYVGKVNKLAKESVPSYYVRKLCEPIYHRERNVTCDNWFTSIPICDKLNEVYGLTLLGTVQKNKREVPQNFKCDPKNNTSAQFAFSDDNKTLPSYNHEKKIVLFLSSLPYNAYVDPETAKPEIVVIYNKTKGGLNSFDKKCHEYTTARMTSRWSDSKEKMKRSAFILDLSLAVIRPFLSRRLTLPTLRLKLRLQIEEFLEYKDRTEDEDVRDIPVTNKMGKQK